MFVFKKISGYKISFYTEIVFLTVLFLIISATAQAEIIWSGDYGNGNFRQWHFSTGCDTTRPALGAIPLYGRPTRMQGDGGLDSYYGDGSLLSLVTSPVRSGTYAAKVTVKSLAGGGSEVNGKDCDPQGGLCTRRRTELSAQVMLSDCYNAMPYMTERWMSVSLFVPKDWDDDGSGWGVTVFQVKPRNETGSSGISPNIELVINKSAWQIYHRWSDVENPQMSDVPWQKQMFYHGNYNQYGEYPRSDNWPDGLRDFPDIQTSYYALRNLNKGGWTDWIIHVKYDARGSNSGGTGFLKIWKREDSGSWVHVLNILPKVTTRGGVTFDHGIGYNSPPTGNNNGGFGIKAGMYLQKELVWGLPANRVIYNDNIKVGSQMATFQMMLPDEPGTQPEALKAPINIRIIN